MINVYQTYLYLALSLFLALIAGKFVKQIKMPNVTGYLIMGLIAGPYCLNIIPLDMIETFSFIPEVALGFIAFSIGSEFKLSYLKKVGKSPIIIAFLEAFMAVLFVDVILIATGHEIPFSLVLGAIAAATAPAATLMVVKQYKAKGPVTDTLLPVVAIDDAAALMCYGLSVAVAKAISSNGQGSIITTITKPVIEILGALAIGAVLGLTFSFLAKWYTGRGNRLAITFAMIFVCIGVCDWLEWSALLACMAMSAVLVNTSSASEVIFNQTDRITPPIFMLFFFLSGAELDMRVIPTVGVIGILYIIFRVLGKVLGASLGAKLTHAVPTVQKYLGFALIPQAGVAIGLATTSMSIVPEYGAKIRTVILCGTVIYELTGPIITKIALKKAGEIQ